MRLPRAAASVAVCLFLLLAVPLPPVLGAGPPGNDEFVNAVVLDGIPSSAIVDASGATRASDDPVCDFYWWHPLAEATVWFLWTATEDRDLVVDTGESEFASQMSVGIYTGAAGALLEVACVSPDNVWEHPHVSARFTSTAGTTYYFMVSNAQGQVALEVADAPVPSNDLFVNATVLTGVPFSETTDTSGAKRAAEDPECATYWETEKQTVWYAYTPASDAWIEANNYGSINDFTMSIGAYTGEQGSLTELACAAGDPLVAPYGAAVRIHVFAGMTYYFMIENASGYTVFNVLDATAPANDDLASAAAIGSLPYADTFAAHYATSADEDPVPSCGPAGAASGMPSVWYKYTPTKSRWLEGTAVAYPDVTVSVWTGPPGALSEVGCASAQVADQIPFRFLANRKVQYLFMVSAASSYWYGSGWGDAAFTLEAGPRPLKGEVNVVKASVDRAGVLTVRGTVRCNHDAMFTELHVTAEGGRRDPGVGDTWWTASCAAPTTPWSVDIPGPFKPGKLSITTAGQFYDGWMTIYTPDETTVLTARRTR